MTAAEEEWKRCFMESVFTPQQRATIVSAVVDYNASSPHTSSWCLECTSAQAADLLMREFNGVLVRGNNTIRLLFHHDAPGSSETSLHRPPPQSATATFPLHVAGLTAQAGVTSRILLDCFQRRYGTCVSAFTVANRGYGFVRFSDRSERDRALVEMERCVLNGAELKMSIPHNEPPAIKLERTLDDEQRHLFAGSSSSSVVARKVVNQVPAAAAAAAAAAAPQETVWYKSSEQATATAAAAAPVRLTVVKKRASDKEEREEEEEEEQTEEEKIKPKKSKRSKRDEDEDDKQDEEEQPMSKKSSRRDKYAKQEEVEHKAKKSSSKRSSSKHAEESDDDEDEDKEEEGRRKSKRASSFTTTAASTTGYLSAPAAATAAVATPNFENMFLHAEKEATMLRFEKRLLEYELKLAAMESEKNNANRLLHVTEQQLGAEQSKIRLLEYLLCVEQAKTSAVVNLRPLLEYMVHALFPPRSDKSCWEELISLLVRRSKNKLSLVAREYATELEPKLGAEEERQMVEILLEMPDRLLAAAPGYVLEDPSLIGFVCCSPASTALRLAMAVCLLKCQALLVERGDGEARELLHQVAYLAANGKRRFKLKNGRCKPVE